MSMPFSEKLNQLLGKYKRSQRWLAKKSGVHYVTVNRLINNYPYRVTRDTAQKLAKALGCTNQERDELINLAGGIPKDVEAILLNRPDIIEAVRRMGKRAGQTPRAEGEKR